MKRYRPAFKYRWSDWWELRWPGYVCMVIGHKTPPSRKFGGELLCPRCSKQVGRWRP